MSFFLLTFSKRARHAPSVERFEDAEEAMRVFTQRERAFRGDEKRGVVLLIAEDEETLRRTHGHYWYDVDELLAPLKR